MKVLRLALLIVALAFAALLAGCATKDVPPDVRVIDVDVKRYDYTPGTEQTLNVTLGETVLIRVHGLDVTHGFAIVDHDVNIEVPPGQTVEVLFTANRAGDFTIYCTVFCGTGHPQHKGTLHVA